MSVLLVEHQGELFVSPYLCNNGVEFTLQAYNDTLEVWAGGKLIGRFPAGLRLRLEAWVCETIGSAVPLESALPAHPPVAHPEGEPKPADPYPIDTRNGTP